MSGRKDDTNKSRMDLLSPRLLLDAGLVMGFGSKKYGEKNFLGLEKHRVVAALGRHLMEYSLGGEDSDTGLSHLAHIVANAVILHEIDEVKRGQNDGNSRTCGCNCERDWSGDINNLSCGTSELGDCSTRGSGQSSGGVDNRYS